MSRHLIHLFAICAAALIPAGCAPAVAPPRLVVVVVVDQMRADYLDRFGTVFTGGLARLMRDGAVWTNVHHDHGITTTSPGQATLATGVHPSRSGIVGNEWYDRSARRYVYSVADSTARLVGSPADSGRSPRQLLRATVGDWLKAQSWKSKVFSVALKDRTAILMGGLRADGVYWYNRRNGRIVTSTYYREEYPSWVTQFNVTHPPEAFFGTTWDRLLDPDAYGASREDAFAGEHDGQHTTFPHLMGGSEPAPTEWYFRYTFPRTPLADEHMLMFARQLVIAEDLGSDGNPDILFVGCSAADFIGHLYGPLSQEVQDYYLRLDRALGEFFDFLDDRVGRDNYAVVLSSDHGVLLLPQELWRQGKEAGRIRGTELSAVAQAAAARAAGDLGLASPPRVRRSWLQFIFEFDDADDTVHRAALGRAVAAALKALPQVHEAYTYQDLTARHTTDQREYIEAYRRSSHPDRTADITLQLELGYLVTSSSSRTSHGSPYWYDSHVPLIVAGRAVRPGIHEEPRFTVDVAPTIAALLGVAIPDDLDGRSLDLISR